MVKYVYNEDGEVIGEYPEENKPSILKGIISGAGQDIKGFHQYMLKKRDEASKRNQMINILNNRRKGRRKVIPEDNNICHAHQKVRVGW
jgi:hypothetical protein